MKIRTILFMSMIPGIMLSMQSDLTRLSSTLTTLNKFIQSLSTQVPSPFETEVINSLPLIYDINPSKYTSFFMDFVNFFKKLRTFGSFNQPDLLKKELALLNKQLNKITVTGDNIQANTTFDSARSNPSLNPLQQKNLDNAYLFIRTLEEVLNPYVFNNKKTQDLILNSLKDKLKKLQEGAENFSPFTLAAYIAFIGLYAEFIQDKTNFTEIGNMLDNTLQKAFDDNILTSDFPIEIYNIFKNEIPQLPVSSGDIQIFLTPKDLIQEAIAIVKGTKIVWDKSDVIEQLVKIIERTFDVYTTLSGNQKLNTRVAEFSGVFLVYFLNYLYDHQQTISGVGVSLQDQARNAYSLAMETSQDKVIQILNYLEQMLPLNNRVLETIFFYILTIVEKKDLQPAVLKTFIQQHVNTIQNSFATSGTLSDTKFNEAIALACLIVLSVLEKKISDESAQEFIKPLQEASPFLINEILFF